MPHSRLDPARHAGLWCAALDTEKVVEARKEAPRLAMLVHLLVLNFNGRRLLAECLPTVVEAALTSRHRCEVAVVDNDSGDDSVPWLARRFPDVRVVRRPNRGLSSFNEVVAGLEGPVAVLLNNDIKLDPGCVDPLVEPLLSPPPGEPPCFMTAPLCWLFDGATYEGFKTAVTWRWGLVQATALFPGHEAGICAPGLTASAGAALAVDCAKFFALAGFDPLFLPGRLEDLDFAFRGYMAGYQARYVPEAVAYHRGMATFGRVFGAAGCDQLALRNTLLFQWKNLRHPVHVGRHLAGLSLRLAADAVRSPQVSASQRWAFTRALLAALVRWREMRASPYRLTAPVSREREFFRRFSPRQLIRDAAAAALDTPIARLAAVGTTAEPPTIPRASPVEVHR
jgi:N-acetylglucosaminyl-diphospho-decaprenol L-rhamnosyltransferase